MSDAGRFDIDITLSDAVQNWVNYSKHGSSSPATHDYRITAEEISTCDEFDLDAKYDDPIADLTTKNPAQMWGFLSITCGGSCGITCGNTCQVLATCGNTCQVLATCGNSCNLFSGCANCSQQCPTWNQNTCGNTCANNCTFTCVASCQGTCGATCAGTCAPTCAGDTCGADCATLNNCIIP
jgi:hypothetical protein